MRIHLAMAGLSALSASIGLAQGPLTPPGPPAPAFKTYQEVWDKLSEVESKYEALQSKYQGNQLSIASLINLNNLALENLVPGALSWEIANVSSGNSPGWCSLAFNATGQPAISFYDSWPGKDLKFAVLTGDPLPATIQTVDTALEVGQYNSLSFSPRSGNPAIAYYSYNDNTVSADLKFAVYDGANWQTEIVDDQGNGDTGLYPSLKFNSSGNPAIAYQQFVDATLSGTNSLKFAEWDGAAWQITTIETAPFTGHWSSLAFTPGGHPAIAYHSNTNLKYAEFDGANWQISTPVSSTNGISGNSLAFTPAGQPAISFGITRADFSSRDLGYTRFDGSTWHTSLVDTTVNVGQQTCLTFGPTGNPAICYSSFNGLDSALRFIEYNGSAWNFTEVDANGDVGWQSSLAFTGYAWSANTGWINLGELGVQVITTSIAPGTDFDRDGLADAYEAIHAPGGSLGVMNGFSDSDGDGRLDLDEANADTDPFDPEDFFKITLVEQGAGPTFTVNLAWNSKATRLYQVQDNPGFDTATFVDLGSVVPGENGSTTVNLTPPAGKARHIYRVGVNLPLTGGGGGR